MTQNVEFLTLGFRDCGEDQPAVPFAVVADAAEFVLGGFFEDVAGHLGLDDVVGVIVNEACPILVERLAETASNGACAAQIAAATFGPFAPVEVVAREVRELAEPLVGAILWEQLDRVASHLEEEWNRRTKENRILLRKLIFGAEGEPVRDVTKELQTA